MKTDVPRSMIERLVLKGWIPDRICPNVATREYETFVGRKAANIYCHKAQSEEWFVISGTYSSEGRNVLSPCSLLLADKADEALVQRTVDLFLASIDEVIRDTYAVRLLAGAAA